MPEPAVFVLTIEAVAGPLNSEPDGRRYNLLVFARGGAEEEAEAGARRGLDQLGWIEVRVLRSGEITDPGAIPADLQSSYRRAADAGCSVIVYDQP